MKLPRLFAIASLMSMALSSYAVNTDELSKYVFPNNTIASPASITFTDNDEAYLTLSPDRHQILKVNTLTGKTIETVFDVATCRETKIDFIGGFSLSPDKSKILIYQNREKIYRRSFLADYYVYEIRHNILTPLSEKFSRQRCPVFSPDGRAVAFVADNNIYIAKLDYKTEVAVTTDGKANQIINGASDWTYEEEFSTTCSMAWSADNLTLCFIRYDESDVPTFSFPLYKGACNPRDEYDLYPGSLTYKYPKAGMNNSKVTVHAYNVETRKTIDLPLPDNDIEYLPRLCFPEGQNTLYVVALNRHQSKMTLFAVNPKSAVAKAIYSDKSETWISQSVWQSFRFYNDFFVVASERTGFRHLYAYNYSGVKLRTITSGNYEIGNYYGYSAANKCHYFQSTATGAINRRVCRIDSKDQIIPISPESGWAELTASPEMKYYILNYSNAKTPNVFTLYSANGDKKVRTIEDNADVAKRYAGIPQKEFFALNNDGYSLNGYIIKPENFDPQKRYPAIMYQYCGPESQEVRDRWGVDWQQYYARQGYVIACVDGRGTGGRGVKYRDMVYQHLGHYETIDQLAAARHVASLPYVDASRIGIFGWSYGGFEALMAASQPNAPYKAAVAVAPVTDWRYYDTAYTERFMRTPKENAAGYDAASAFNLIDNLKCPLLIMAGTADDNVHIQNTLEYVGALQAKGKLCDMFIFTNMDHSINYCNGRTMVYAKMLDFFNKNL
ncbi:MAG: S9 family peptidase [Muribaculaceae bacterium]|nr:S9 family peptidase [Muribaculaceae bacterium]